MADTIWDGKDCMRFFEIPRTFPVTPVLEWHFDVA
jgi:hypothetical protein